jgi:CubicO group peptidase (beta-lactamase class C family)
LASITKQVAATLLLRDHVDALDRPVAVGATAPTLRQLLTHHGGLPDPDATAINEEGGCLLHSGLGCGSG